MSKAKTTKSATNEAPKTGKPYVIAKTDDGTIQITYTIPSTRIKKEEDKVLTEYAGKVNIAGFRKGNAPISKVKEQIPGNTLVEHILSHILPEMLASTIETEKFNLAIYPKFQLVSAEEGKDWQVTAITCEVPQVELGDYKKEIVGKVRANSLWTPPGFEHPSGRKSEKGKPGGGQKDPTPEEKEQLVIKALIDTAKIKLPKVLIDEEVNSRLSKLLERIEKLGLSLEQYLASVGKTVETLRKDYESQAQDAITFELALNKVAEKESVEASEKDVEAALQASMANPDVKATSITPEQKQHVRAILRKKAALDKLVSYL